MPELFCTEALYSVGRKSVTESSLEIRSFLQDDGTIHYGALMRYWRKHVMQWKSAQILADVYNELLSDEEPLTVRAIQRMEQQNKVPMDQKRRRLLATILHLPPAYFGLTSLAPYTLPANDIPAIPIQGGSVDSAEYQAKLQDYWIGWTKYATQEVLVDLLTRVHTLQEALLYGGTVQRETIALLLCQYLVLYGNIRRDQGYSDSAISYLDKAIAIAGEKGYSELGAKAYYLKGYAQFDKWGIQPDRMRGHTQLQCAIDSFQSALSLIKENKKAFNGPLNSAIVAELGLVNAYCAQSAKDQTMALNTIDAASTIMQKKDFHRDTQFMYVDDEWYHIDKAEAYVALHWGREAVHQLENIDRSNPQTRRRYVYTDIVEADAYLSRGQIEMAVACAENALDLLDDIQSFIFVTRISNMYNELRRDERYMRSPDVARLGGKLLKVQHAYLFDKQ
jgi:tetratricopeptide (TPR) repeat protein